MGLKCIHTVHQKYSEGSRGRWATEQMIPRTDNTMRLSLHLCEDVHYKLQQSHSDNHTSVHSMKEKKKKVKSKSHTD